MLESEDRAELIERSHNPSSRTYDWVLNRIPVVVFELTPEGTFLKVNQAAIQVTGYKNEEFIGKDWQELLFPGEQSAQIDLLYHRFRSGDVSNHELTMTTKAGDQVIVELNSANYYDIKGKLEQIIVFAIDISVQKRAEERLKRRENELASAQQIAQLGSWIWDIPSDTINWSEELCRIFGLDKDDFKLNYEGILERIHPEDLDMVTKLIEAAYHNLAPFEFEHRIIRPDGEVRTLLARGEVICDAQGVPLRMVGTGQDITKHKQDEKTLRESEEHYRQVIESIKDYAIFTLDPTGKVTSWNAGAEAIKGYLVDEVLGSHFSRFYPEDEIAAGTPENALLLAASNGRHISEGWRVRKGGSRFWANIVITALYDEQGSLRGFVKIVRDMTQRRQAELALQRQTKFVELLKEVAVAANEADTIEVATQFAIDRLCAFTGWLVGHAYILAGEAKEELISLGVWHLADPHRFLEFRQISENMRFAPGIDLPGQVLALGEFVWISDILQEFDYSRKEVAQRSQLRMAVAFPVLAGKKVVGVLEFYSDEVTEPDQELLEVIAHISTQLGRVVERKISEEALRRSEARFRIIFEGASTGIILLDLQGRILECNPAVCAMLGYNAEELYQMTLSDVSHPAYALANTNLFDDFRAGRRDHYQTEKPYLRKDDHLVWVHSSITLVRDDENKPQYAIGMLEDITTRKQMEAELAEVQLRLMESREAERVHLSQELHDGPVQDLYGLTFHLNALTSNLPAREKRLADELQVTLQQVINTLRAICGDLRPPTLAPFGLEKAIRSHVATFQETHPNLKVELDLVPDGQALPERVRFALFRIYQQIITNVVRHANANQVLIHFSFDEYQVVLEIKDDGGGFEVPDRWINLARRGHLGLVGAFERAEAIGGLLTISSSPGKGTLVRLVVPRNNHQFLGLSVND